MQRQTTVSLWCERILEAGWLLALSLIPIYFNLLSARHFEPDKATTLRSIVLVMAAVALIRALEQLHLGGSSAGRPAMAQPESVTATNPLVGLWQRINRIPMAVSVIIYSSVFVISTITSIVPHTSLWGSYQRLQGTYTNLSYVGLFVLIVMTLRRREQLERLITVVLITALMVSFYGVMQHNGFDPLPWKGDVIQRVASTMGNSIFVAAYLIMTVPLALYRVINGVVESRRATADNNNPMDVVWALAYAVLVVGTMMLLVSAIKFGAEVHAADFRYWWVFPGAVVVSTGLWVLPTLDLQHRDKAPPIWPGAVFLGYLLLLGPLFLYTAGSDKQQIDPNLAEGISWWVWLLISLGAVVVFYVMAYALPRSTGQRSRLNVWMGVVGSGMILVSMLLTIFYSKSRGPWLGMGAGLFVFLTLFLWLAGRRASQSGSAGLAKILKGSLVVWGIASLGTLAFILVFNFSHAPFFNELRTNPYLGRLGTMFKSDVGTGLVRRLIWTGDEHVGGTVALITSDPFRTVVGWGPESMFVAFNPFYPPSLANIEARTASPDRAHQAILDELATKGVLGLISYFFVLTSFLVLSWQIISRSEEWQWQVLGIASFSAVTAHFFEGMTGIPIVATLTMLWTMFAVTVLAGYFAGHYSLSGEPVVPEAERVDTNDDTLEAAAVASETSDNAEQIGGADADVEKPVVLAKAETKPATQKSATGRSKHKGKANQPQQGRTASGRATGNTASGRATGSTSGRGAGTSATQRRTGSARVSSSTRIVHQQTSIAALGLYALILLITFGAVWWFNISPVYADMRFHEGDTFSQEGAGINEQIYGLHRYLDAIRHNPKEDFYYLNLGRSLMNIAEFYRSNGAPMGEDDPTVTLEDLLALDEIQDVGNFVQTKSPMLLMSYSRAVLERARELNPRNKDHYANLARFNNFLYNWTQNIETLKVSADWYDQANEVAPYDVALINESASVQLMLASLLSSVNDPDSQHYFDQSEALYKQSLLYDPNYGDADARLAEIYRVESRLPEAANLYAQAIRRDPHQFDQQTEVLAATFAGQPDLLRTIRDAYEEQANDAQLHAIAGLLSVQVGDMDNASESYEQAVQLEPDNLGNRRNYTLILSDTMEYSRALVQATAALSLTRQQEGAEADAAQLEYLVHFLEQVAHNE